MALLDEINNVIDLNAAQDGSVLEGNTGRDNLTRFRAAVSRCRSDIAVHPTTWRGTLYLPPGTYRIAADPTLLRPDPANPGGVVGPRWATNLAGVTDPGLTAAIIAARLANVGGEPNPFGASLVIPEGLTLWLAPKAILVPEAGCIIDISSALVAENAPLFDLSAGGLVVFGSQVPIVRAEWWAFDADSRHPIQRAIDAAIHNRSIHWSDRSPGGQSVRRPPLEVVIRGRYEVRETLEVDGSKTVNDISRLLSPGPAQNGVDILGSDTATVIGGGWSGRARSGATIRAAPSLGLVPLLHLHYCAGLTIRNLAFESMAPTASGYQPCLVVWISTAGASGTDTPSAHATNVRGCRFQGRSTPLVQVGERFLITFPPDDITPPFAAPSFQGSDFSLLSFDECVFAPDGGVALDCVAHQSYPIRYRRCDFVGDADAMLSLWDANHYLDGCYFENRRGPMAPAPAPANPYSVGLEAPDGADVFLRVHPRQMGRDGVDTASHSFLAGLTAIGCVSRSARFLSTVRPRPAPYVLQLANMPVVLLNIRHIPATASSVPSVAWGMANFRDNAVRLGPPETRRMGLGGPMVVIGGTYGSEFSIMAGAVQSAVVGARQGGAAIPITLQGTRTKGAGILPLPSTCVFGLAVDQPTDLFSWTR